MTTKSLFFILLSICLAAIPLSAETTVHTNMESAQEALEQTIEDLLDIMYTEAGENLTAKEAKIEKRVEESFSFLVIAQRVLGASWRDFSPEQQKAFTAKFKTVLMRSYTRRFGQADRPKINYQKAVILARGRAEIRSKAILESSAYSVDYRLAEIPNLGWQVYDIIIEGVSLTGNYRKQFSSILRSRSPEDVISILNKKIEETANQ